MQAAPEKTKNAVQVQSRLTRGDVGGGHGDKAAGR